MDSRNQLSGKEGGAGGEGPKKNDERCCFLGDKIGLKAKG